MKGWKTVLFNVVMAIVASVYALNPQAEVPTAEQVHAGVNALEVAWGSVLVVGNLLLRAVTTSGIFKKE